MTSLIGYLKVIWCFRNQSDYMFLNTMHLQLSFHSGFCSSISLNTTETLYINQFGDRNESRVC